MDVSDSKEVVDQESGRVLSFAKSTDFKTLVKDHAHDPVTELTKEFEDIAETIEASTSFDKTKYLFELTPQMRKNPELMEIYNRIRFYVDEIEQYW